jgi:hypothetical protein
MSTDPLESSVSEAAPEQPAEAAPAPLAEAEPGDSIQYDLNVLRLCVCVLGAALFAGSLCFNLYLYKQNNLLISQIDHQTRVLAQNEPVYENTRKRLNLLLQDLQGYAQTHSDVVPILVKHNFARVQPQSNLFGQ